MDKLLLIITTALITWALVYEFLYSPKAQVKKLWDEIFKYASRMSKFKGVETTNVLLHGQIVYDLESMQDRAGRLINSILEHEHPSLEDEEPEIQEYVSDNKYEIKHKG